MTKICFFFLCLFCVCLVWFEIGKEIAHASMYAYVLICVRYDVDAFSVTDPPPGFFSPSLTQTKQKEDIVFEAQKHTTYLDAQYEYVYIP